MSTPQTTRRSFIAGGSAAALVVPRWARGQQGRVPIVGWLGGSGEPHPVFDAIKDFGYVDGRDFLLVIAHHGGDRSRLPGLAAELVARRPDVIATAGDPALEAVVEVTRTIPIVGVLTEDLANRLVGKNWGRPAGNVTGVVTQLNGEVGKQLEILVEAFPASRRIGILGDRARVQGRMAELETAVASLGREAIFAPFNGAEEFAAALDTLARERVDAIVATESVPQETATWAAAARVPVIYNGVARSEAGGLMAYGLDTRPMFPVRAEYIVRILEGALPADLPLRVAPSVLVLNLKAAREMGVIFPASILARADVVLDA